MTPEGNEGTSVVMFEASMTFMFGVTSPVDGSATAALVPCAGANCSLSDARGILCVSGDSKNGAMTLGATAPTAVLKGTSTRPFLIVEAPGIRFAVSANF